MNNRDRIAIQMDELIDRCKVEEDSLTLFTETVLGGIVMELAGLNDELHALNLKLDKLTREVGKRK